MGKYIYWNKNLILENYTDDIIMLSIDSDAESTEYETRRKILKETIQKFQINDVAAKIICLIDGTKTLSEVVLSLADDYPDNIETISRKVDSFLKDLENKYNLNCLYQSDKINRAVKQRPFVTHYPRVASIEITSGCNLRCKHCYGDYGEIEYHSFSLEQVKKILNDLKDIGIRIVEFTGGEATTHPNIIEILEYAFALNFEQVSLLTNGVSISPELKSLLVKEKSRAFLQIDLQDLNDDYLSWFTGASYTLDIIKENIEFFASNDVLLRIATTITPKNVGSLEGIADWIYAKGIKHWAISPVTLVGRAERDKGDLCLDEKMAMAMYNKIEEIITKYPGLISVINEERKKPLNCGCMTSHVVISSTGEIKLCTMDNLQYFNSSIGNVINENIRDIYDRNREFINGLFKMPAPNYIRTECTECSEVAFCNGCVLRGLIKASELKDECKWFSRIVPEKIKRKLELIDS